MFVYVCIYVGKKKDVWGLTTGKSPVSIIYCSLVEFNGQEKGLTTPDNLFRERNLATAVQTCNIITCRYSLY